MTTNTQVEELPPLLEAMRIVLNGFGVDADSELLDNLGGVVQHYSNKALELAKIDAKIEEVRNFDLSIYSPNTTIFQYNDHVEDYRSNRLSELNKQKEELLNEQ
jgi:hypothetical protein